MNGVHDMGGMHCFGPVDPDPDEPLFHEAWERRVLALALAMGATGTWNLDESRSARESLPPDFYLSAGYYRIWLAALEQLLVKHTLVTEDELASGKAIGVSRRLNILEAGQVASVLQKGSPVSRVTDSTPLYKIGDTVKVRHYQPPGHTRLPGYIRGRSGTVTRVHGCHVYPDSHATGEGEDPQWLYNVSFDAALIVGEGQNDKDAREKSGFAAVRVDCWEPYLCNDTTGDAPGSGSGERT